MDSPAKKNPHAVILGRRGGKVRSDRKAIAVRANGALRLPVFPCQSCGHAKHRHRRAKGGGACRACDCSRYLLELAPSA